ncbi:MAG: hypothetical protein KIT82_15635 [Bradyrhizobium sp.]|nr:hypothetical protein [Bradyrhizobium sp.]
MSKPNPKYAVHVRWGDFEINIVGRRTILWWAGTICVLLGIKAYGVKALEVLSGLT